MTLPPILVEWQLLPFCVGERTGGYSEIKRIKWKVAADHNPNNMTLNQSASTGMTTSKRTFGRRYQSLVVMLSITLLMFGGIGSRLAYLQLIEGTRNRQLAENNRIRLIQKQPNGALF